MTPARPPIAPTSTDWDTTTTRLRHQIPASAAANTSWYAGNTRIMNLDSSGNLAISGLITSAAAAVANASSLVASNGNAITFTIGSSEKARIDPQGNLGLNCPNPAFLLDVYGPQHVTGNVLIGNTTLASPCSLIQTSTVGTAYYGLDAYYAYGASIGISANTPGVLGFCVGSGYGAYNASAASHDAHIQRSAWH